MESMYNAVEGNFSQMIFPRILCFLLVSCNGAQKINGEPRDVSLYLHFAI